MDSKLFGIMVLKEKKCDVIDIWLAILLVIVCSGLTSFITYKIFYKKGFRKGIKHREDEILNEYCMYAPIGELSQLAETLMTEDELPPTFPVMMIRPSMYNYVDGIMPPEDD